MKTFFIATGSAILGAVLGTLFLVLVGGLIVSNFAANVSRPAALSDSMVLELDMRSPLPDQIQNSGLNALFGRPDSFIETILKIEAAAEDERVEGIFIRGSEFGVGSARSEELRAALKTFQSAGKFVIAHSQGAYGGGPSSYRSVATADEIWMQPGSELIAPGIGFETLFLRGLLDNLDITPDIQGFYEYKSAASTYLETDYTEPHREALTGLANTFWNAALKDIAEDRRLQIDVLEATLESSPLSAEVMIESGLADAAGWPEDARDAALNRASENAELTYIGTYTPPQPAFGAPAIAVVGAQGVVVTGGSGGSLLNEGEGFASDTIAGALLDAAYDDSVSAIVFRIDSPGGSPTASDQVWRAVQRVRNEHNKPVIVSMASTAASGGYYAAASADWIVANRSTITGSIGIVGGKIGVADALARIGVNAKSIMIGGEFTGAVTTTAAFTPEQRALFTDYLKRGYDRFVDVVAEGRKMSVEEVHERARGRVWSGEDALQNGLVDQLGGISTAVTKARELAEIDAETDIRIQYYPLAPEGLTIGSPSFVSSTEELKALGKLTEVLSDPTVEALLQELQAARTPGLQARLPDYQER